MTPSEIAGIATTAWLFGVLAGALGWRRLRGRRWIGFARQSEIRKLAVARLALSRATTAFVFAHRSMRVGPGQDATRALHLQEISRSRARLDSALRDWDAAVAPFAMPTSGPAVLPATVARFDPGGVVDAVNGDKVAMTRLVLHLRHGDRALLRSLRPFVHRRGKWSRLLRAVCGMAAESFACVIGEWAAPYWSGEPRGAKDRRAIKPAIMSSGGAVSLAGSD